MALSQKHLDIDSDENEGVGDTAPYHAEQDALKAKVAEQETIIAENPTVGALYKSLLEKRKARIAQLDKYFIGERRVMEAIAARKKLDAAERLKPTGEAKGFAKLPLPSA